MGEAKCTSCHKAIVVMTGRACRVKAMHIYYGNVYLL